MPFLWPIEAGSSYIKTLETHFDETLNRAVFFERGIPGVDPLKDFYNIAQKELKRVIVSAIPHEEAM